MDRKEFLRQLRKRLSMLTDDEIDDIINEYEDVIHQKMQDGKTEEEAVHDFGDFEELLKEICGAYKIKSDRKYDTWSKIEEVLKDTVDEISNFITKLFSQTNGHEESRLIAIIIVGLFILIILRIPFLIGINLFEGIVKSVFFIGGDVLVICLRILIDILFFLIAVLIAVGIYKSWKNGEEFDLKAILGGAKNGDNSKKSKVSSHASTQQMKDEASKDIPTEREVEAEKKHSEHYTGSSAEPLNAYKKNNSIITLLIWIFRVFGFMIVIPITIAIVLLSLTLGLFVYLSIPSGNFIGICLAICGLIAGFALAAEILCGVMFFKRELIRNWAGKFVMVGLLIGIGVPMSIYQLKVFEEVELEYSEVALVDYDANNTYTFYNIDTIEVVENPKVSDMHIEVQSYCPVTLEYINVNGTTISLSDKNVDIETLTWIIDCLKSGKVSVNQGNLYDIRVMVPTLEEFKYIIME
ncbi:MAG: DUF1700 domain-containing protein [Anaerorhabdus sp.]